MSWKIFEEDSPKLAALAYEKLNRRIAYLATLKKDGSPRLHPVTPFIGNGMLFIFTEPSSPKIQDLLRDGRYVMHCTVGGEGSLIEVSVSGEAMMISNSRVWREQAERIAASPVVMDSYALFDFQVKRVLVVEYDEERKPVIRRWRRDEARN
ncbi:MAG: pyridoxamine 5'-phosphate oxidase family protein [Anaerolineales bacterium]|nr:pyridoxamine 5'-phosphate oxidase family protein [Anaerolineales bacterium]